MTKRDKLLQKVRQNPKNVSIEEMSTLLGYFDFHLERSRGSHYSFKREAKGKAYLLVIPVKHPLKVVYVKRALTLIDKIQTEDKTND